VDEVKLWGFYSEKSARLFGSVTYSTPDGGEVEVTAVSLSPDYSDYKWDDLISAGPVLKYLRTNVTRIDASRILDHIERVEKTKKVK
jgi:hypothetical protein